MTPSRPSLPFARAIALCSVGLLLAAVAFVAAGQSASAATAVAVTFEVSGAQGGNGNGGSGGAGGTVVASATFDAGTQISVYVGGSNGFNGGGPGGAFSAGSGITGPGPGGGATDLRMGGTTLADRVLVAGGGGGRGGGWLTGCCIGGTGGAGGQAPGSGGHGGGSGSGNGGGGATSSAVGSGGGPSFGSDAGSPGSGSTGGAGANSQGQAGAGGGGGGGWFGGGGGAGGCCLGGAGGGGGGSSFVAGTFTDVSSTTGTRSGNGLVRISLDGGSTWVTTFSSTGSAQTYTVPEPPHPLSLDVTKGPAGGGTVVTVTGTDLTDASAVLFCGQPGTGLDVQSATTLVVSTPPGAVGSCDVRVNTNASGTGALTGAFRYFAVPVVSSVTPAEGSTGGGNAVAIEGSGFTGATAVTFGGNAATFAVDDDTTITATVPAHASGAVDVTVTTPDSSGTGTSVYTYFNGPTINAVAPDGGPVAGGTSVTITGSDFTGTSAVTFGGGAATTFAVVNDTTVTADVPPHAEGPVDVTFTNPAGQDTLDDGFTYHVAPSLYSVSPSTGPIHGGTVVTLTGSDLTATSRVTFDGIDGTDIHVLNDATVEVTSPAHAVATVDLVVTQPGGTATLPASYSYVEAPTVASATPEAGPATGGTVVTITGTHLAETNAVTFGGTASTDVVVVDDETVTAVTPAGGLGARDIVLSSPGGTSTLTGAFTYTEPARLRLGATEVAWNSDLDVRGRGFAPGSDVVVTLHSDPVVLGRFDAGADGRFDLVVSVPEVTPGTHEVTAEGVDAFGTSLSMAVTLTVSDAASAASPTESGAPTAADASDDTLPRTGSDPLSLVLVGLGLLVVGGGLTLSRRRTLS